MPSANKTPNYGLNQWQGNEYPKRQDFVEDNAAIDAAIKARASETSGLAGTGRTTETVKANADAIAAHKADKSNPHGVTASQVGAVPTTRKINSHALSADVTLTAADVGAVPSADKGAANGIATLDAAGKVPKSQLPTTGGYVRQGTAPADTSLLWVDSANGNVMKYYNGTAWAPVPATWG